MGKSLLVSEFDLKFGQDDHLLDVYAVFKEDKRGDVLAIYSDRKDSFSKKITKKDVDRILSLGNNAYSVLNDETVYGVRGSAYN